MRSLSKLIGTTDISKIGDGTLTGIVSALNTDIQGYKDYVSYVRGIGGNSQGWHRIARNQGKYKGDSCVISVKRIWNHSTPEYQKIQFLRAGRTQKFVSLIAFSGTHVWTKIREAYYETEDCSYLEIYQSVVAANWWLITIEDAVGSYEGANWKAIPPELTQETVSGMEVLASLDLPANNPVKY